MYGFGAARIVALESLYLKERENQGNGLESGQTSEFIPETGASKRGT